MRSVTVLILLGAIAFTQAFKVEIDGGRVNITGKGPMCVDVDYMPVRYLNKSLPFSGQCKHGLFGGVLKAHMSGALTIGFGFIHNDITPNLLLPEVDIAATYELSYGEEFKEFNSPDETFLDTKFSELGCAEPQVSLAMAVRVVLGTTVEYKVFAVQDFVISNCLEQERAANVWVQGDFEPDSKLTVHLKQTEDGKIPTVDLSEVINRLTFKARDFGLPPNGDGLVWPRGLLFFMTHRDVQKCDEKNARMTAEDEWLHFIPVEDEVPKDQEFEVFTTANKAPEVMFGRMKGGRCLFCSEVTIVIAYDFLGRYSNNPCDSFTHFRTSIDCSALATEPQLPPLDFAQPVPNPITQGNSVWLRLCNPEFGYKVMKIDGGSERTAYRWIGSPYELKGAGRLLVTAAIYNHFKDSQCPTILGSDELLQKEKALVSLAPMCKAFVTATLKTDNQYYPEFKEYLKTNCSDDPTVLRLFTYDKILADVQQSMSKGLCPDGGLRPEDAFNDDFSERGSEDKFYKAWGASMARAVKEDAANCDDYVQEDLCGFRAAAQLMSTGKRMMANHDLWYDHATVEDYGMKYDDAKKTFDDWLGVDTDVMRRCPRPDMWKPYNVYPAVWRMTEDGLSRGFFSGLHDRWCYTPVLRWGCPECSPDKHPVAHTGTNSTHNPDK